MKKLKKVLLVLLAAVLILSLCGCDALDQMRENQVFLDEDGNISYNGVTYKKLPQCDLLYPETTNSIYLYVTEPDVPVLLSAAFVQEYLNVSSDGNFLFNYDSNYCASDMYEEICKRIEEPFTPEVMCYEYDYYDVEIDDFRWETYTLTKEQMDAVSLVLQSVEPVDMSQWSLNYDWSVSLQECSSDLLFRRGYLEIVSSENDFFLVRYSDQGTQVYPVPDGCWDIFNQIVSAYIDPYADLTEPTAATV